MGAGSWGEGPSLHQLGETLVFQPAAAAPQTAAWTEASLSAQEACPPGIVLHHVCPL